MGQSKSAIWGKKAILRSTKNSDLQMEEDQGRGAPHWIDSQYNTQLRFFLDFNL